MSLSAGTKLGPYEILVPLGAGGMGEVYKARDTRLGREVAVKVLPAEFASDPERLRRFEQEARATAALDHPNILAVYDIGTHEGTPYIVEQLLEGESLRQRLRGGPLPPAKAVEFGVQIAHGLAAAHEKGIVHRDLKPENLFVTKDGHVKILDFGLARLRQQEPLEPQGQSEATTADSPTREGKVLGTPGYMSPEQVRGKPVDARTDIFAFGVVLYEMLAGKRAFAGDTAADTQSAILSKDPDPLPPVTPQSLDRVVRRCLEKRPDDRFQSAHDLALALEVASSAPQALLPAEVSAPERRGWTPRRRVMRGGAALLLTAALAGVLLWHPWKSNSSPTAPATLVPSLVALPCKVYGAPDMAFLTDAVPQTISTFLAQTQGLDTKVPPTSIEAEKAKGDLATLAQLYQVSNFVVTSVNASAEGFTLNVQLVDAATRKVRWGKQFEGPRSAYNDLARQAAGGICQAFKLADSPVPASGVSSEVELALREGDYFSHRYAEFFLLTDFTTALEAYRRAMAADPTLASARAETGRLYWTKFTVEGSTSGALKDAETWAHRALELDPRCGQAWSLLSRLEWISTNPNLERQIEYALKAASLEPRTGFCHIAVSNAVACPGALSLALAAAREAVDADPFLPGPNGNVIEELSLLGRPREAEPFADHLMRVAPDNCYYAYTKGLMFLKSGRLDEARATMDRWEPQYREHPDGPNSKLWGLARFRLAAAANDGATMATLEKNIISPLLDGRADAITLENGTLYVCPALATIGRKDDALHILLRSVEMGVPPPYDFILCEPEFKPLQDDPRFAKVVTASRDGAAWLAKILEKARARGELPAYLNQPLDDMEKLLKSPKAAT